MRRRPAELACADPDNPCLIESFLTGDPPLKQVVSHTWEAGLRGDFQPSLRERGDWSFGLFRALNTDDIITVAAPNAGRGFFENVGDTLRQGIEASITYRSDRSDDLRELQLHRRDVPHANFICPRPTTRRIEPRCAPTPGPSR